MTEALTTYLSVDLFRRLAEYLSSNDPCRVMIFCGDILESEQIGPIVATFTFSDERPAFETLGLARPLMHECWRDDQPPG